jgi:hypothetical protein
MQQLAYVNVLLPILVITAKKHVRMKFHAQIIKYVKMELVLNATLQTVKDQVVI